MKAKLGLAAILVAAWWVSINTAWVTIGDQSLTGGELAGWLNLVPAIALASLFIASYGKFKLPLGILAGSTIFYAGFITLSFDWGQSHAVTQVLETLSGVLNADQHAAGVPVTVTAGNIFSAVFAFSAGSAAIFSVVKSRPRVEREVKSETSDVSDNRALWDEQS